MASQNICIELASNQIKTEQYGNFVFTRKSIIPAKCLLFIEIRENSKIENMVCKIQT